MVSTYPCLASVVFTDYKLLHTGPYILKVVVSLPVRSSVTGSLLNQSLHLKSPRQHFTK